MNEPYAPIGYTQESSEEIQTRIRELDLIIAKCNGKLGAIAAAPSDYEEFMQEVDRTNNN